MVEEPALTPSRRPWAEHYPAGVQWLADIPERPVQALLDDAVARFAARPFLDFFGRRQSYAEVARLVAKAARGFQRLGLRKGMKVGLLLPNTPYSVICYFAILGAGGTVVNYDPLCSKATLFRQIEDSETDIMVTLDAPALYGKVAAARGTTRLRCIVLCALAASMPWPRNLLFRMTRRRDIARLSPGSGDVSFRELIANDGACTAVEIAPSSDIAVIQYTAGTTGEPRGVMLSHQNIYANTCQIRSWFTRAEPGAERLLAIIPFSHAFGMTAVMNFAVSLGGELVIFPRFQLKQMLRAIERKHATILVGVPGLFRAISECRELHRHDLSSLKICISGGDALPRAVQTKFAALTGCPLAEGYGLSECAPVVTCSNPLEGLERAGSCGLPLPRTAVEIVSLEAPRTLLPAGEVGEIRVSGPQVMLGYWRNAEATHDCLIDGWFHTGDVGRMDADGFLYFVDRLKEVIVVHGYKIYPRKIEDAIRLHSAVAEVAVHAVADPIRGEVPKASIVLAEGAALSEGELRAFLADKLSPIEIPRLVEFRRELPRSAAGKVLKRAV